MCLGSSGPSAPPPLPPPAAPYKQPIVRADLTPDDQKRRRMIAGVATSGQGVPGVANVAGNSLLGGTPA